jgi:hypothetical protein
MTTEILTRREGNYNTANFNQYKQVSLNMHDASMVDNSAEMTNVQQILVGRPKCRNKSKTQSLKNDLKDAPCSILNSPKGQDVSKCNRELVKSKADKKEKKGLLCGIFSCF